MIDQELLIRSINDATTEVFATMLDMQVRMTDEPSDARTSDSGLISLVGITGDWGGSGVFCCTPALAETICVRMLGCEPKPGGPFIDEETLDVVAEVTNMTIGNIKNALEPVLGPLAISVPTVIHGKNFQFRNTTGVQGTALLFEAEGQRFEVRVSLAPSTEKAMNRFRIPVLDLAHV